jgi:release factor glutamine methyltransferase
MAANPQPLIAQLMREAQAALCDAQHVSGSEARIEARMLLCRALGDVAPAWLIARERDTVPAEGQALFADLLRRRLAGEPLAYILGEREFYGLKFRVTPDVLVPRPETELLVELALERIPSSPLSPKESMFRMLDLGTGSGAVALSVAHARPHVMVTAVDASPEALEVARDNARRLTIRNVEFVRSGWFSGLAGECFDLIVSNPPYVAEGDAHLREGGLRFEPRAALVSGADGLDDIRAIIEQGKDHLASGGWLLLEHGYGQAGGVRGLLLQHGFGAVFSARDLAGVERVSGGSG